MKIKQVFILSFLSFTMLISLTSCIVTYKYYDIDSEDVLSVGIYDLRDSETHYNDFLESETPVYTIEKEQMADFLNDLSDIRFSDTIIITLAAVDPSFYYGEWVVRINYTDGSYSLISCGGYGESYDINNKVTDSNHFSCEDDEWEQFIGKYVPKDIFGSQE